MTTISENKTYVGPHHLRKRVGDRFRPRLRTDDLKGLRWSIAEVLDTMPAANAQRHYIEALDMRVDEWLDTPDSDFKRPRVSLADLDVMLRVCTHAAAIHISDGLKRQIERMIEVIRSGGW